MLNLGVRWGVRSTPRAGRFSPGKVTQYLFSKISVPVIVKSLFKTASET